MIPIRSQSGPIGLLAGLFLCLCPNPAETDEPSGMVRVRIDIDDRSVEVLETDGLTSIRLDGAYLDRRPGEPAIPSLPIRVALPPGTIATDARAHSVSAMVRPVGRMRSVDTPVALRVAAGRGPSARVVAPDPIIYEGVAPFPGRLIELTGTARLDGHPVACLTLHPVQYLPADGAVRVHTVLEIEVITVPDGAGGQRGGRRSSSPIGEALLRRSVINPPENGSDRRSATATSFDSERWEYVIITTRAMEGAFRPLAEWKTRKGVPAAVVTTQAIDRDYPGEHAAERIRNFLIDARATRGTSFVLLGGAFPTVAHRSAWAMDCEAGLDEMENWIPADLYFSDLDGTWDGDGDGIYGETTDDVDLYPDLLVGRVPARDADEARTWVAKVLTYEQAPPRDYQSRVLLCAEVLWDRPYTDAGVGMDMLDERCFGPTHDPITKLYESRGNESPYTVISNLDTGPHLVAHDGHAWIDVMSVGTGNLTPTDALGLQNGDRTFLITSIGCWAGAFDRWAILGRFLVGPEGGAVAAVGNSRYGWGAPGNPGYGYSDRLQQAFFDALLVRGATRLGEALALAKIETIPFARDENVYRWVQYCVNLFGDPEMSIYTREPDVLEILGPAQLAVGEGVFSVLVTGPGGVIEGARVCLLDEEGTGWVGVTDGSGRVEFVMPGLGVGVLSLTATAPDHVPVERTLPVVESTAPLLVQASCPVADSGGGTWGNGDGEINPGETIALRPVLRNLGGGIATGVMATLSCDDPRVVVGGGATTWDDLSPQQEAPAREPLRVSIQPGETSSWCALLSLDIVTDGQPVREEVLSLEIVRADPVVVGCRVFESVGDMDGVLEAGETAGLLLDLRNEGTGTLPEARASLSSTDPHVDLSQSVTFLRRPIPPEGVGAFTDLVMVEVHPDCPRPWYLAPLEIVIEDGFSTWSVSLPLSVGVSGFTDDMEAGEGEWVTTSHRGQWSLSSSRAHSGRRSWSCAGSDGRYEDDAEMELRSPPLVVPPHASLRFWRYLDVPTYGTDGLYVEVVAGGETRVLDFVGSGGALGGALFVSGWAEAIYPLDLEPGTMARVGFRFVSDGVDGGEGVYIDDVRVIGDEVTQRDGPSVSPTPLAAPWPNPFATTLLLQVDLARAGPTRLVIYDVGGRRVRTLIDGPIGAGLHPILWDGRDDSGRQTAAGRYFVRLEGGGIWQRPVVRVR